MASEILFPYDTGRTLYAMFFADADGTVWNTATPALEAYAGANITNYNVALSELGTASGLYQGSVPALAVGSYTMVICERAGASPAQTDAKVGIGQFWWTGSAMIKFNSNWNAAVIDSAGNFAADVNKWLATTVATPATAGYPVVLHKSGTGVGELNLASGVVDANAVQIAGNATAADNAEAYFVGGLVTGNVNDASPATTDFNGSAGLSATDSFYVGSVLAFTSGTLAGLARRITSYTGATKNLTFAQAWPTAPANSDTFVILGRIDA